MNIQYTGSFGEGANKFYESQMYPKQCILYTQAHLEKEPTNSTKSQMYPGQYSSYTGSLEASLIVSDFTISVSGSSCNYLILAPLLSPSIF